MQVTEGGKTKTKKFHKESKIPDGCDINDIRAKFTNNELHVTMPKKITPQIAQEKKLETKGAHIPQTEHEKKLETKGAHTSQTEQEKKLETKGAHTRSDDQPKDDHIFGLGSSLKRLQAQKKVSLSIGVAVAVIAAIGAYAAYNYGSCPSSSSSQIEK